MLIVRQQNFSVDFFEFTHEGSKYRVGLGHYKNQDPGCEMFYPEAGSDYMLVIFDNGWYKFRMDEFTHTFGTPYISEKLKCSERDALAIHTFIVEMLEADAAFSYLTGKVQLRNPLLPR